MRDFARRGSSRFDSEPTNVRIVVSPEARAEEATSALTPIVRSPSVDEAVPDTVRSDSIDSLPRFRILLVDDNCHQRAAQAHALRAEHSVATAPSIPGMLRLLASERFDAILVVYRPDATGLDTLEVAAVAFPQCRRLLLGKGRVPGVSRAIAKGIVEHVFTTLPEVVGALGYCAMPRVR